MRHVSIAFWTFVSPMLAARSMRIALLLAFAFLTVIGGVALSGLVSADLVRAALIGAQEFLVILGLPIAAAILAEIPLRDGISHRTLLYPLLGPVPRFTLAGVRTLLMAATLGIGVFALLGFTRFLQGPEGWAMIPRDFLTGVLGGGAYVAMFGLLHVLNRRGLITGLSIFFIFDLPLRLLPFRIRNLSPSYHVGILADQREDLSLPIQLEAVDSSVWFSSLVLLALTIVFTLATAAAFRRKSLGEVC